MGTKNKNLLKSFRKNVVTQTYQFVVSRANDFDEDAWELIFVDAESMDIAQTKAKETADAYGYTCEPEFVKIIEKH